MMDGETVKKNPQEELSGNVNCAPYTELCLLCGEESLTRVQSNIIFIQKVDGDGSCVAPHSSRICSVQACNWHMAHCTCMHFGISDPPLITLLFQ